MKGLMLLFVVWCLTSVFGYKSPVAEAWEEAEQIEEAVFASEVQEEAATEEPVYVEEPIQSTQTTVSESVILMPDDSAEYQASIAPNNYLYEDAQKPMYVKDGVLYTISLKRDGDKYTNFLKATDLKTGKTVGDALEFKNNAMTMTLNCVFPCEDGGYIGMDNQYDEIEGWVHFLVKFDSGRYITNYVKLDEMAKGSYITGHVVSDGSNVYFVYACDSANGPTGGVMMYDSELKYVKTLIESGNAVICRGNDNRIYMYDGFKNILSVYDSKTDTLKELSNDFVYARFMYAGAGDEILIGYDEVYSYSPQAGMVQKLFEFKDYDLDPYWCYFAYRDSDGTIVVNIEQFEKGSQTTIESLDARFKRQ